MDVPKPEASIDPLCGECSHPKSRHSDYDTPGPAECEDCTGPGQPWRHEFLAPEFADEEDCRAAQYVGVADSYNGASLCGCDNCREYVAERESEDEV
jgi:hypothetical protein